MWHNGLSKLDMNFEMGRSPTTLYELQAVSSFLVSFASSCYRVAIVKLVSNRYYPNL